MYSQSVKRFKLLKYHNLESINGPPEILRRRSYPRLPSGLCEIKFTTTIKSLCEMFRGRSLAHSSGTNRCRLNGLQVPYSSTLPSAFGIGSRKGWRNFFLTNLLRSSNLKYGMILCPCLLFVRRMNRLCMSVKAITPDYLRHTIFNFIKRHSMIMTYKDFYNHFQGLVIEFKLNHRSMLTDSNSISG